MELKDKIHTIRTELVNERDLVRKELSRYPNASLMISTDHGYFYKYQVVKTDGRRKKQSLGKNDDIVHRLARKAFLEELMTRLNRNLKLIDDAAQQFVRTDTLGIIKSLPANFDTLPEEFLLTPACRSYRSPQGPTPDISVPLQPAALTTCGVPPAEWGAMPYRPNSLRPEEKRNVMKNGMRIRSKSEASMMALLESCGIPYHYDEVLSFNALIIACGGNGDLQLLDRAFETEIIRSPDLIVARRDGKLIFIEHFGRMDDPAYAAEAQEKLRIYRACGIVPWDDLIISFEEPGGGIDMRLFEAQLKNKGLI